MRNTIIRSYNENSVLCLVYKDNAIVEERLFIPSGFDTIASAEKYIRKNVQLSGKFVDVVSIEKVSELYGMSEADFVAIAKPVDERSKETRGFISKTVVALGGTLLYMDASRKVCEMPVIIPNGMKKDKAIRFLTPANCKGIDIVDIHKVEHLYVLSADDFKKNARVMSDYQHYAK